MQDGPSAVWHLTDPPLHVMARERLAKLTEQRMQRARELGLIPCDAGAEPAA